MPTFNQLKKHQSRKPKKIVKTVLSGYPQKKGYCARVYEVKPKKPNSAIRKIAKVVLSFGRDKKRNILAYIPGIGLHNLQNLSTVLVRGGRVPDLPGVRYHIIRSKYDFTVKENFTRMNRRSKFSTKRIKK
uniref:Ribosomal protein S12 n=1 Tax=Heterostelium pallidum TaxID=13642 RepID=Q5ILL4_HETPA|nr:ribosomal protein S12 [Heterostelium pallidum]AAU00596.1 ribosomal protein S12 [Heterostelium pallidum]